MNKKILSPQDGEQVIRLLEEVDYFAGTATGILRTALKREKPVTINLIKKMRDSWYNDKSLLDAFLASPYTKLDEQEREIVKAWRNNLTGTFLCVTYEENGAIMRPVIDNDLQPYYYSVLGITQDFETMIEQKPPYIVKTTLLVYKDMVISDGLVLINPREFSPEIKQMLLEDWQDFKLAQNTSTIAAD